MKIKLSKQKLNQIIKEEAIRLKSEFILKEDVKNKISLLENEVSDIEEQMRSIYSEDEVDESLQEILGFGPQAKAKKAYQEMYAQQLDALKKAYKSYDPSYIEISRSLVEKLRQDASNLAKQFGVKDVQFLYKELLEMVQPMDYNTFKRQAEKGGFSMRDVASGASTGAKDFGF